MSGTPSRELVNLISKRFIARPDVKAIQNSDGSWKPHTTDGKYESPRVPWSRPDLESHLTGDRTFGHYMLSTEDNVKLFAFDIDLKENQLDPEKPNVYQGHWVDDNGVVHEFDAREAWRDRAHPSRAFTKMQLQLVATTFAGAITDELAIPTAIAYSGGKGVHVYGFTGLMPAADAREGALIVLDSIGGWEPLRGDNFYQTTDLDPATGFPNLSIELFPKQSSLSGKNLGNLMRLPLGRNMKAPKDPTFFIDPVSPMGSFKPMDPMQALDGDIWKAS